MKMRNYLKTFFLIMMLLLSSCGPKPDIPAILPPEPSHTPTSVRSATPTLLPSPSHTASPSPSPSPTATPEPITFKVGKNDDMFSIALYFGVSLEALKTANPQVIPNAMSIGTELIIPITPTPGVDNENEPSPGVSASTIPAPEHVSTYKSYCYRDASKAVYCFSLIENDSDEALENVSLLITLSDETGKTAQTIATTLINVIPPHSSLPAASYFLPEWGETLTVSAELDFQLPYGEGETRYLETEALEPKVDYLYNKKAARVQGLISFENKNTVFMSLNIVAVAYDENGAVLGMRRNGPLESSSTSANVPYSITVYSLAGDIHHVEIFVEAMPFPPEASQTSTP